MIKKHLIVIVGPTAVGKTSLTVELANVLKCQVLNADSRQVFQELSIGTAKPTKAELQGIKHYFIDDRSINTEFSAGHFEREGLRQLEEIFEKDNLAILSGGSGLYIDALCYGFSDMPNVNKGLRAELKNKATKEGIYSLYKELQTLDPDYAKQIDPENQQRIVRALEVCISSGKPFSSYRTGSLLPRNFQIHFIGLELPRNILYERINSRMDDMIANGLFEEAERMLPYKTHNALQTVGYTEVFGYMEGKYDREEAIRLLKRNSRRYAKRQLTWFKKNDKIKWFEPTQLDDIIAHIKSWVT